MSGLLLPILALAAAPAADDRVVALARDWRSAARAERVGGIPDYSPPALARWSARLAAMRAQLAALDRRGLATEQRTDLALVEAEMNGLDFQLRVLRPWARDPGYYAAIWSEQSDVPDHEGSNAVVIDLWRYRYPLGATDAKALAARLDLIPALLDRARVNLAGSTAHDLFAYSARAFHEQAETLGKLAAGTLDLRSLEGRRRAELGPNGRVLLPVIERARVASERFAAWIGAEAPKRTGPSGVGIANYDWAAKHVTLSGYDWAAQETLLKRELSRAWAGLKLEEVRNRALPPLELARDPATYDRLSREKAERFTNFLVDKGFVADTPYYRAAIPAQSVRWVPPAARDFFAHVVAADPQPLYSHDWHWIELARLAHEPSADPVRRTPPMFNIWQDRSEGVATAMEEIAMTAGLYDDLPRGRELVWIMLANRAARGLASLYVQANRMTLAEAGRFHARWTPRGWSDPASPLVGFEQLLYLRQPGYGTSYIVGKVQLDDLLARLAERADKAGRPFDAATAIRDMGRSTPIPLTLVEAELAGDR